MVLEQELATYREKLPELIAGNNEGKFALIQGKKLADVFGTYEDAIKQGYARFGLAPFLVKRIESVERPQFVSRLFPSCPTLPGR